MSQERPGKVITFYSYKGGTGRTMALANVACLLAQRQGQRVLMIDWDLEAPGLHQYFQDKFTRRFGNEGVKGFAAHPGLVELFLALDDAVQSALSAEEAFIEEEETSALLNEVDLEQFILETDIPSLYFLKAGSFDSKYASRVNTGALWRWPSAPGLRAPLRRCKVP